MLLNIPSISKVDRRGWFSPRKLIPAVLMEFQWSPCTNTMNFTAQERF
jgi:hypothetical protein